MIERIRGWFGKKDMGKVSDEERTEARRLLGDVVGDTIERSEIATLVRKVIPTTGCARRRRALNDLHRKLLG